MLQLITNLSDFPGIRFVRRDLSWSIRLTHRRQPSPCQGENDETAYH